MLPTALRCLTFTLRSCRSSSLEVFCDPLQGLESRLRAPLQYTCCSYFHSPSFDTDTLQDRPQKSADVYSSCSRLPQLQHRQYCQQPTVRSDDIFQYEGPLQKAVGNLKKLSLFSCGVTILTSPVILFLDTSATPLGPKAGIAATLCVFGAFTTGLLHWFTSPYVRRLVYDRKSQTVELHIWSVFARPQTTRIHLSEIRYPDTMRPQVTFQARGKIFFLDAEHFQDKALLAALTPEEPSAAAPSDKQLR